MIRTMISFIIITSLFLLFSFFGCNSENPIITTSEDTLVFANAMIIDGTGSEAIEHATLIVICDKIHMVSNSTDISLPDGARVFDLEGKTILPGFINAHVHGSYNQNQLKNWVRGGVTTVRDLSPLGEANFIEKRNGYNQNPFNARLVSSTPIITCSGGYGGSFVDTPESAEIRVLDYINSGVDIIKFSIEDNCQGRWNVISQEIANIIVSTAHSNNLRASVHITHDYNIEMALIAGVDDIAHMVTEPMTDELVQQIVEANIYWTPTLELWKGVSEYYSIDLDQVAIRNLRKFFNAGGNVALGTDFAGFHTSFDSGLPFTEIQSMKEAGMSNMDIIVAATLNAAYVCGMENEIGTIEVGKIADLLIINGNPLTDIDVLRNVSMVIHNGHIVREE
ncbi:MAG: amidohydrolase family protein [Bacteroidetes bacterium]|nr:amidohydrolase family protein [Bacteroidota bacterium]